MRKYTTVILVLMIFINFGTLKSQDTLDKIHLFQTFFHDATISKTPYGEGSLQIADYDGFSSFSLGAQGGFGINPNLEVGGGISFVSWNPSIGDSQSGISDLLVTGRYLLPVQGLKAAAGGYITLPIGSDKVGGGHLNFGAFGALRHPLQNGLVITGTLGFDLIETNKAPDYSNLTYEQLMSGYEPKTETEHDLSVLLGGGAIYPVNKQLHVVAELNIRTKGDYMLLSGGADYELPQLGRVRGFLGLGLDDGAPDFILMGSFLKTF